MGAARQRHQHVHGRARQLGAQVGQQVVDRLEALVELLFGDGQTF